MFNLIDDMRSIILLIFLGIVNIYSVPGQTSMIDSIVSLALKDSESALFDARFEKANEIINLSYFKNFKDFKVEHEIQLLIQKMRIDAIANNVWNKKTNHGANLDTLLQFLPDSININDTKVLGQLFFALSQSYHANQIKDSALIYRDKSLGIYQDIGNFEKIAEIRAYDISVRHNILFHRGDKDQIIELIPEYEKQIEISELYSKYVYAYNTRHLGQIYRRQTLDYKKALQLFKLSLNLRLEIGFKPYLPASYASLGDVYMKMGEDKRAIDMYLESFRLAEEIGFIRFQLYPNLQIGDIYFEKLNNEKAYEYYSKALKLATENNYLSGIDQSNDRIKQLNLSVRKK